MAIFSSDLAGSGFFYENIVFLVLMIFLFILATLQVVRSRRIPAAKLTFRYYWIPTLWVCTVSMIISLLDPYGWYDTPLKNLNRALFFPTLNICLALFADERLNTFLFRGVKRLVSEFELKNNVTESLLSIALSQEKYSIISAVVGILFNVLGVTLTLIYSDIKYVWVSMVGNILSFTALTFVNIGATKYVFNVCKENNFSESKTQTQLQKISTTMTYCLVIMILGFIMIIIDRFHPYMTSYSDPEDPALVQWGLCQPPDWCITDQNFGTSAQFIVISGGLWIVWIGAEEAAPQLSTVALQNV